jgi:chaperonin GroES
MSTGNKRKIILVGDRILIQPETDQDRSPHGLYLPPGVREKEKVNSGWVVQTGPGYPVVNPNYIDQEPWSTTPKDPVKYIPLQAEVGDLALFLRDQAIEIEFERKKYLIVPQSGLLMLIRPNPLDQLNSMTERSDE